MLLTYGRPFGFEERGDFCARDRIRLTIKITMQPAANPGRKARYGSYARPRWLGSITLRVQNYVVMRNSLTDLNRPEYRLLLCSLIIVILIGFCLPTQLDLIKFRSMSSLFPQSCAIRILVCRSEMPCGIMRSA